MDIEAPSGGSSWKGVLIALLVLLILLAVIVAGTGSFSLAGSQSQTKGCPTFDERAEAFKQAQVAELWRHEHPFGGNYGLGSYLICYTSGPPTPYQTPVFKGNDNKNQSQGPAQITHSEQATYRWLTIKLSALSLKQSSVVAIEVLIFSQVVVCPPCRADMPSWQAGLRAAAKTENLFLSIWDIASGKGFDPAAFPKGTGKPISPDDLQRVDIPFTFVFPTEGDRRKGTG